MGREAKARAERRKQRAAALAKPMNFERIAARLALERARVGR